MACKSSFLGGSVFFPLNIFLYTIKYATIKSKAMAMSMIIPSSKYSLESEKSSGKLKV
jgi:hypothetical protein